MTAREAAKDLIKFSVLGGATVEQLASGMLGAANENYCASIGGYINNQDQRGELYFVRKIDRYQIGIERLEGKNCDELFSLQELYHEILNETKFGIQEKLF